MAEQQKEQSWEPKNAWVFFLPLSCLTCNLGNGETEGLGKLLIVKMEIRRNAQLSFQFHLVCVLSAQPASWWWWL